jgi:hypothetical protein
MSFSFVTSDINRIDPAEKLHAEQSGEYVASIIHWFFAKKRVQAAP